MGDDIYTMYDFSKISFIVHVSKDNRQVSIYQKKKHYKILIYTIYDPVDIFIGKDFLRHSKGNTILINLYKNRYMFVGSEIYTFVSLDKIINFYCNSLPNNICYPVSEGERNLYFMYEHKVIPKPKNLSDAQIAKSHLIFYTIPKNICKSFKDLCILKN